MNTNKSAAYGYYGGVTPGNHYTPPPVPEVVPQPPRATFTQNDKILLQQLVQQTQFFVENSPDILLRTHVPNPSSAEMFTSEESNIDTFVLHTSANPEDVIVYTSERDNFNLNITNGGTF